MKILGLILRNLPTILELIRQAQELSPGRREQLRIVVRPVPGEEHNGIL